ncbi:hypothetical protein TruAng_006833 [Truncatella angustata]|nr:hypothetical protein TruAng_006833 [Truncatella angustata]
MEAFGLVSAAAGVASFGITVCEGLLTYYSSWKDAYDTVRSMYENIEALAKTFVILERTISNPTLSEAARHRVEESIESCRKGIAALRKKLDKIEKSSAQQSWKERTWVRIKGTIYPFKESTLLKLKEGCIELRHDVGLALATLQINTSVRSLDKLAAFDERMFEVPNNIETILGNSNVLLNHMENLVASGKSILHLLVLFSRSVVVNLLIATKGEVLTKICDWLSPLAGDFERRQQELSSTLDRQEGMARWLFNTSEFKSWIHDTGTALWCTGMHGIGKSVLVSFVVDILHQARASEGVGVAYIYCNYEEAHRQSPSNLIAALLLQFVIQQNTVSEDLLSLYEHHMKNKTRPLLNEYLRLLQDTIAEFSKVYVMDWKDTELVTLGLNVLGWIYYAKRPLTLIELQHALAVEPRDTFLDEDGMPDKDLLTQEFSISTPGLVLASAFGLKRIGSLLLQHDADIEDEDARGLRPIHQALWEGHDAMVQFLINEGADCEIPIGSHEPPQHSSLVMQGAPVHLASIKGNELAVDLLLAKSVNVNAHLENGWTALHMAAANGHSSVVSLLLRNGAEVNATDSAGGTAIYRAAETGQDGVIKLLVQHKGNVNMRTKLEQTPLLRAAENGHGAAVTLLLESGADWKIKDFLGWTPLYRAQDHGHDDVEKLLKKWIKEHREKGQAKQDSMALRG